jgi:hypothetical protein
MGVHRTSDERHVHRRDQPERRRHSRCREVVPVLRYVQTVVFEGRDKPQTMDLSGVILHETHLQALYEWTQKRNPIVIKDDLLREFTVVIEEFTPTRKRSALYPWKHEFRLKATLLVPYAGFV